MQNFSYENKFDLHENELAGETHFHKNGFTLILVLTQKQIRTRKWPGLLMGKNLINGSKESVISFLIFIQKKIIRSRIFPSHYSHSSINLTI